MRSHSVISHLDALASRLPMSESDWNLEIQQPTIHIGRANERGKKPSSNNYEGRRRC